MGLDPRAHRKNGRRQPIFGLLTTRFPLTYDSQTRVVPNEEDEPDPTQAPVDRFRARGLEETRRLHRVASKSVTGVRGAQEKTRKLGSTTTVRD